MGCKLAFGRPPLSRRKEKGTNQWEFLGREWGKGGGSHHERRKVGGKQGDRKITGEANPTRRLTQESPTKEVEGVRYIKSGKKTFHGKKEGVLIASGGKRG